MKRLYLGPKVRVRLPFVLIKKQKLLALLVAISLSFPVIAQELVFTDPKLETGTDRADGAVYRFKSVRPNVDALLKIN